MLELETCLQQQVRIVLPRPSISDLATSLPALGRQLVPARELAYALLTSSAT